MYGSGRGHSEAQLVGGVAAHAQVSFKYYETEEYTEWTETLKLQNILPARCVIQPDSRGSMQGARLLASRVPETCAETCGVVWCDVVLWAQGADLAARAGTGESSPRGGGETGSAGG